MIKIFLLNHSHCRKCELINSLRFWKSYKKLDLFNLILIFVNYLKYLIINKVNDTKAVKIDKPTLNQFVKYSLGSPGTTNRSLP